LKYEAIVFDLDGTLWNSNKTCTGAWNTVLQDLANNTRITVRDMDSVSGKPIEECINMLLPGIKQKHGNINELLTESERNYIDRYGSVMYADVLENIIKLADLFKIYIVSNCQEWYLQKFIQISKLSHVLSGWDCFGRSGREKSKMLMAIKKKNKIKSAVYVGDTMHDRESANQADMDFIQVTYGFGEPIEDAVKFNNFKDLRDYFLSDGN